MKDLQSQPQGRDLSNTIDAVKTEMAEFTSQMENFQ